MHILVTVKQLGKKHPFLKAVPIALPHISEQETLKDVLLAVVAQQVQAFNGRVEGKNLLPFLTEKQQDTQAAETGKVGFNAMYNATKADVSKAQTRMLEAFEDGLFVVFQNDTQLEDLTQTLHMKEQSAFTFLRLAFLSGSYYY